MSFSFKEGNIWTKGHFQALCFLHTTQLLMASILLNSDEASLGGKETCPVLPSCPLEDSLEGAGGGGSLQIARLACFLLEKQDGSELFLCLAGRWASLARCGRAQPRPCWEAGHHRSKVVAELRVFGRWPARKRSSGPSASLDQLTLEQSWGRQFWKQLTPGMLRTVTEEGKTRHLHVTQRMQLG